MSNLEGSGVAVKKWMQGKLVSRGRTDTMLPVVQKPSESMQMPLGLSLKMDIITSAVTEPEARDGVKEQQNRGTFESSRRVFQSYKSGPFSPLCCCNSSVPPL